MKKKQRLKGKDEKYKKSKSEYTDTIDKLLDYSKKLNDIANFVRDPVGTTARKCIENREQIKQSLRATSDAPSTFKSVCQKNHHR